MVANHGRARAGTSTAALSVKAKGRWRTVKRFDIARISAHASRTVTIAATLPTGLPSGALPLRVCADSGQAVPERDNTNNCRTIGTTAVSAPKPVPAQVPAPAPVPTPTPVPTPAPVPPVPLSRPASSVPTAPITPVKGDATYRTDSEGGYWIFVPESYDDTHATPTPLLIWMHGCGGTDSGEIYNVAPTGAANYIAVSPDGREGTCWDPNTDMPKVLAAIADVKTHLNVDPRQVVVGGYSSGGDLAYRTAFYNAYTFAGVLAENTSPFRDTGSTQAQSLAAAYWKFHVVHLAHTGDTEYPLAGVRSETDAMTAAGFPVTRVERPGDHSDANTDTDMQSLLLPHMADGWLAPP